MSEGPHTNSSRVLDKRNVLADAALENDWYKI